MVPKNAEAGDARGMCLYAQMLENGLGVKKKRGARAGMVRQGRGGRIHPTIISDSICSRPEAPMARLSQGLCVRCGCGSPKPGNPSPQRGHFT